MNELSKRIVCTLTALLLSGSTLLLQSCKDGASKKESPGRNDSIDYRLTVGAIERAFKARQSDVNIVEKGTIVKVLSDDVFGSKHQRFIVELTTGHTVLVAHNIDLAPRVPELRRGQPIVFCGEYEWNPKGGVIHWTHRDPKGWHKDGWLEYQGKRYQ